MNRLACIVAAALLVSACSSTLAEPLPHAGRRSTPLHFGVYVTPDAAENPIDPPERFIGYHAAVDYEVSADELDADVPVYAICSGEILHSGYTEGYGGNLVHRCTIDGEPVTVLYGHLLIESLPEPGGQVEKGQRIASLAPAYSYDSGETRKHLHLGIHHGSDLSYLGYVQDEVGLTSFIDPVNVLPAAPILRLLFKIEPYWQE